MDKIMEMHDRIEQLTGGLSVQEVVEEKERLDKENRELRKDFATIEIYLIQHNFQKIRELAKQHGLHD